MILVVVNLDPAYTQVGLGGHAFTREPWDLDPDQPYQVHDLLTDARYLWHGTAELRGAEPARACRPTSSGFAARSGSEQEFELRSSDG